MYFRYIIRTLLSVVVAMMHLLSGEIFGILDVIELYISHSSLRPYEPFAGYASAGTYGPGIFMQM